MRRTLVIVLATAIVGGLAGASIGLAFNKGGSTTSAQPAPSSARAVGRLDAEQIYRGDSPGVVVITDSQTQVVPASFFSPAQREQVAALGSGFVIDERGDIVTNDHVVQGAKDIRVGFSGGASYPAKIVGSDPSTDIAVVRVKGAPASVLRPLRFADSNVEVGDPAYAIGNPFGLERTMTAGIVSAIGPRHSGSERSRDRQCDPDGRADQPRQLRRTAARPRRTGDRHQFADRGRHGQRERRRRIRDPQRHRQSVSEQLIATGHAEHAWLGVEVATIDPSVAKIVRGLPAHGVVVVKVVKGSPAAKAGLKAATRQVTVNGIETFVGGDAIVAVDGKPVSSTAQLGDVVALHKPGDALQLEVVRGGKSRTVAVTLGNAPG